VFGLCASYPDANDAARCVDDPLAGAGHGCDPLEGAPPAS